MTFDELVSDKKFTRKVLAQMVLDESAKLGKVLIEKNTIAANLSEMIGDAENTRTFGNHSSHKRYNLKDALDRAFELIIEARKVPELEQGFKEVNGERERLQHLLDTTIKERNRAQEATALVGATFNDYRSDEKRTVEVELDEADIASTMRSLRRDLNR